MLIYNTKRVLLYVFICEKYYFCFSLSLAEIIDILEVEDEIIEGTVYTCPPSNHMLSDADSDQEDALLVDLNHLTGNQLRTSNSFHRQDKKRAISTTCLSPGM